MAVDQPSRYVVTDDELREGLARIHEGEEDNLKIVLLRDADYRAHTERLAALSYEQVIADLKPIATERHRSTMLHYQLVRQSKTGDGFANDLSTFYYHWDWTLTFPLYVRRFIRITSENLRSRQKAKRDLALTGKRITLALQAGERSKPQGRRRGWRKPKAPELITLAECRTFWRDYHLRLWTPPRLRELADLLCRRFNVTIPQQQRALLTALGRNVGRDRRKSAKDLHRELNDFFGGAK